MSGEFPFIDNSPAQLLQSIVNDGVFFSSAWMGKSEDGMSLDRVGDLILARRFVRLMLRKDAGSRLTAMDALSHPFISSSGGELKTLYDDMVLAPWSVRGERAAVVANKDIQVEVLANVVVENESHTALTKIDGNNLEQRERKRQYMVGKENDSQVNGEEEPLMKKKKIYDE